MESDEKARQARPAASRSAALAAGSQSAEVDRSPRQTAQRRQLASQFGETAVLRAPTAAATPVAQLGRDKKGSSNKEPAKETEADKRKRERVAAREEKEKERLRLLDEEAQAVREKKSTANTRKQALAAERALRADGVRTTNDQAIKAIRDQVRNARGIVGQEHYNAGNNPNLQTQGGSKNPLPVSKGAASDNFTLSEVVTNLDASDSAAFKVRFVHEGYNNILVHVQ